MALSKIFKTLFFLICVALLGAAFCWYWYKGESITLSAPESAAHTEHAGLAPRQTTYRVRSHLSKAQDTQLTEDYSGITKPFRETDVEAQISGRVQKVHIEEGDFVEKGDLLFTIYDDDRTNKLLAARAQVTLRQMQFSAAEKLEAKKFTSPISLAKARNNLEGAKLSLKAAELEHARLKVRAPFSGVVNKVFVEPNSTLSISMMELKLCKIIALSPLFVTIEVPERAYSHIRELESVNVRLADQRQLEGEVVFISALANEKTKTFRMKVKINNETRALPAGMTVNVGVPLSFSNVHKVAPSWVVLSREGVAGIMGIVERRARFFPVNIVRARKDAFFVSGLPEEVRIITLGQNAIKDGVLVSHIDVKK